MNRALNAQDVHEISQRLLAKKRLSAEAARAKLDADKKMEEAKATLEIAKKRCVFPAVDDDQQIPWQASASYSVEQADS